MNLGLGIKSHRILDLLLLRDRIHAEAVDHEKQTRILSERQLILFPCLVILSALARMV